VPTSVPGVAAAHALPDQDLAFEPYVDADVKAAAPAVQLAAE
jgi:hypothetical protein